MAVKFAEPEEPKIEELDEFSQNVYSYLKQTIGWNDARQVWMQGQRIPELPERTRFYAAVVEQLECERLGIDRNPLEEYGMYRWQPVSVYEFMTGEYYLNKGDEIYPKVMEALVELNSGKYIEAVLTGGIGSAKTTTALYTMAYQVYLLSCMRSPQKSFGLDTSSEILLIFQSITAKLAKQVDFTRFKSMLEGVPYFKEHFPFDKNVESKLVFPNRIEVIPVSGAETAAIGQNVIGGLIDELNYMAVVQQSKQSVDSGTFDQAVALYNSIARRRKSRFLSSGKLPGILCLVSSKKYPGQFTDRKQDEAKTDPTIYVYDKRVWDVKPEGTFTQGWFKVFIGDETRKPRILESNEVLPEEDQHLVMDIPEDFRQDFITDIINSLREIAGVSTLARHPYFLETQKVAAAFKRRQSVFSRSEVDFVDTKLMLHKEAFFEPQIPRFAHVDLAISGDSAGVCIGCVDRFIPMSELRGGKSNEEGFMPHIHIDGILEVRPPRNSEILFYKIRSIFTKLREMGLNIRWITFDSFQSTDSQQLLRQQAFVTGTESMDVLPCKPYDFTKSAIYDGRVDIPFHARLQREINMLERDLKTGKIDHPPNGSKDCADALAGVVYGLTMRREVWGMFGIPLTQIPVSVAASVNKDKLEQKNDRLVQGQQLAATEKVSRSISNYR